jgi:cellulose synthase/poly-beta-1,6-N-acetylglucosamine synthase-like glycosyltransferase
MQCVEYAMSGFVRMLIGKLNSLPVAPAFTIFRREFLLKYGYFDVGNLTEDFEMGLRVQHAGYNIAYIADSCALTGVPGTFKKLQRQRLRWGYGTMYNYKKYKQMILNPKYGDLGMFILPTWIFGFFLTSAVFLFLIYNAISKCIETFQKLVAGWIPSFVFDIEKAAFTFTELRFLLFVLSFIMALLAFLLTKAEIDDEIRFIDFVPFLLIYPWILALAYLNAIYHLVRGEKPAW